MSEQPTGQPATPSESESKSASNLRGILWMLLGTVLIAMMHSSIHHVTETVHPFVAVFFRLIFALLVVVPFFIREGWAPLKTDRLGLLILRGVINFGAMICFFTALSLSPVADITALSFSAPLFATVLAIFFLKEKVGWRRIVAILIGFGGTVVVLRPGFEEISTGYLLALAATVFWGTCVIIIKNLSKTESSVTITAYMSLVMAPMALVPALFVWSWPSPTEFAWLVVLGLLGGAGQMSVTQALKHAETHIVMPFDFVRLIWVALISVLFFAEIPDIFVWAGGTLIFSSTAYITIREHRVRKREEALAASASTDVIR